MAPAPVTAERYPWIGIRVTSGPSFQPPPKVRFISKPWRAAEVPALVEGA